MNFTTTTILRAAAAIAKDHFDAAKLAILSVFDRSIDGLITKLEAFDTKLDAYMAREEALIEAAEAKAESLRDAADLLDAEADERAERVARAERIQTRLNNLLA